MSSSYRAILKDDFWGGAINADLWEGVDIAGAGASAILMNFMGGGMRVTTGGALNNERLQRMLNTASPFKVAKYFVYEVRMKITQNTTYDMYIEMYNGAQEYIRLLMGTSTANGAVSTTATGGNTTANNITYAHDTSLHKFTILGTSSSVKFLIDEVLKQNHTTYITGADLYPRWGVKTLVAGTREINVDYVFLGTNRE